MSLKFLERVYDYSTDRWVWLDIRKDSVYVDNIKKDAPKYISKGFYSLDWNFVYGNRGGEVQCSYCGLFLNVRDVTRDHVVPKSQGGTFTAPACKSCNDLKKDICPIQWAIESSLSGLAFGERKDISKTLVILTKGRKRK